MNPTGIDWTVRQDLHHDFAGCGASDRICFLSPTCNSDVDCLGLARNCQTDGVCYVNNNLKGLPNPNDCQDIDATTSLPVSQICPKGCITEKTDCEAIPGVDVIISCTNLILAEQMTKPRIIKAGETAQFISVVKLMDNAAGNSVCSYKVVGNDANGKFIEGIEKELILEVN